MSELDKWFPRTDKPQEPPAEPEPGVIEGVKRDPPKRYGWRWYRRTRRRCKTTWNRGESNANRSRPAIQPTSITGRRVKSVDKLEYPQRSE